MLKVKVLPSKKSNLEIIQKGDQLWTTSLDIAEKFSKRHDNVIRDIENLECSKNFKLLNFEELSQTVRGGTQKYYIISRDGFSFLAMGFRGKKAAEWKEKFIEAFNQMEKTILHLAYQARRQGQKEWLEARAESKIVRREETDMIKKFVEYAFRQGSKNAKRYYENISKMENKALFYLEQTLPKPNNFRDWLDRMQLMQIGVADNIVSRALQEGMDKGMHYKDIYIMAKERIENYAKIVGRTPLLPIDNRQLLISSSMN